MCKHLGKCLLNQPKPTCIEAMLGKLPWFERKNYLLREVKVKSLVLSSFNSLKFSSWPTRTLPFPAGDSSSASSFQWILGGKKEVELERNKPLRIPSYVNIGMLPLRSRKHQKTMQNILPGVAHKGHKSPGTVIHCPTWCVRIYIRNYIFPRYMFERFASGSSWYINIYIYICCSLSQVDTTQLYSINLYHNIYSSSRL